MKPWVAYPSSTNNGVRGPTRSLVDPVESIGTPFDSPATSQHDQNSAFSLLKGICSHLGVPVGSGQGEVNTSANIYADPLATLGDMNDAPATDTGAHSAISLMKGILTTAGFV